MSDVPPALQDLFRRVFDDDDLSLDSATTAADIDGWDSMAHINLIIAIEKQFGITFSAAEIAALGKAGQNVGSIARLLATKTGQT